MPGKEPLPTSNLKCIRHSQLDLDEGPNATIASAATAIVGKELGDREVMHLCQKWQRKGQLRYADPGVWKATCGVYADRSVTPIHAVCRPGNHIGSIAEKRSLC